MNWENCIEYYTNTHCLARGLQPSSIDLYKRTLIKFGQHMKDQYGFEFPDDIRRKHILGYLKYLRSELKNCSSTVNNKATAIRTFYSTLVADEALDHNPFTNMGKLKKGDKKLPNVLSEGEIERLLSAPPTDCILGLRDRAILMLLYGTGIRASECIDLLESDVDFIEKKILVMGKGRHERVCPLNDSVVAALKLYKNARGPLPEESNFFLTRSRKPMTRGALYDRVRKHAVKAGIKRRVSPHTLRHTCATHLVKVAKTIVEIRDLLCHKQLSSTQIYMHVSGEDLREVADNHPIKYFAPMVEHLLPDIKLPWQHPPKRRLRLS